MIGLGTLIVISRVISFFIGNFNFKYAALFWTTSSNSIVSIEGLFLKSFQRHEWTSSAKALE